MNKINLKAIIKKLLILFIAIVLVSVGVGIYYAKDLVIGYKYYTSTYQVGVSQEPNLIDLAIEEYLQKLENEGYYVAAHYLNFEVFCKSAIVHKSKIDDNDTKQNIIKSLSVDVLSTKLKLKDDDNYYYFNTENDCNDFIAELNKYITQECEVKENDIVSYKLITSKDKLDSKINSTIEKKKELDAIAEQKRIEAERLKAQAQASKVTSRGGLVERKTTTTKVSANGKILANYVYISSQYGMRHGKMHTGVDFAAPKNTEIYAWKGGKVVTANWSGGYGNFIEIQHDDGTISRYGHLNSYAVAAGQTVSAGQLIGYVGTTGNSTGYHLHFEIKINGNFVNPISYL